MMEKKKFETGFSGAHVEKEEMIAQLYQTIFELRRKLGKSRAHRKFSWRLEVHQL